MQTALNPLNISKHTDFSVPNHQSAIYVNIPLSQSGDIWNQIKDSYNIEIPNQKLSKQSKLKQDVYTFDFQSAQQSIVLNQAMHLEYQDDDSVKHFIQPALQDIFSIGITNQAKVQPSKNIFQMTQSQIREQKIIFEPIQEYRNKPQKLIALFYDQISNDFVQKSQVIQNQRWEPMADCLDHFIEAQQQVQQIKNISQILSPIYQEPTVKSSSIRPISKKCEVKPRQRKFSDINFQQRKINNEQLEKKVIYLEKKIQKYEICQQMDSYYCELQTPQKKLKRVQISRLGSKQQDNQSEVKTICRQANDSKMKPRRKLHETTITKTIDLTIQQPTFQQQNAYLQQIKRLSQTVNQLKRQNLKLKNQVQQHKCCQSSLAHYQSNNYENKLQSDRKLRKFGTIYKTNMNQFKNRTSDKYKEFFAKRSIPLNRQNNVQTIFQSPLAHPKENSINFNDLDAKIKSGQFNDPPNYGQTQQQLIQLAQKTFKSLGVKLFQSIQRVKVEKYQNCVLMKLAQNSYLLWFFNGKFYVGGWREDFQERQKQGYGYEYLPQKFIYQGQFKNGKRNGFGKMENLATKIVYVGQWVNGLKEGYGKQRQEAELYEGYWEKGKKQGQGMIYKITAQNIIGDQLFKGQFHNNLKNGQGKQMLQNGDTYDGHYQNGRFHGNGLYRWKSGAVYQGKFFNGNRQGKGKWTSQQGDIYQGNYKNNMKEGYGIYKWKNGDIFSGIFCKDKQTNQGKLNIFKNKNNASQSKTRKRKVTSHQSNILNIRKLSIEAQKTEQKDQSKRQGRILSRKTKQSKSELVQTYF